jgi:hypothetical protein
VVAPKRFIQRLRLDNELFRSHMHQDAHEFLNFVLNCCCDLLETEARFLYCVATCHGKRSLRVWCPGAREAAAGGARGAQAARAHLGARAV